MLLTDTQRDMLDGKYGKGKAMAARILTAVGESFRAVRLVPVTRVHVSLSAQGAVCAVAPTVNPGYSVCYFKSRSMLSPDAEEKMCIRDRCGAEGGPCRGHSVLPGMRDTICLQCAFLKNCGRYDICLRQHVVAATGPSPDVYKRQP